MTIPEILDLVQHAASVITYVMVSAAAGMHALAGFGRGLDGGAQALRQWALASASKADDAWAERFARWAHAFAVSAARADAFVGKAASLHSRLFPQPRTTPHYETVRDERVEQEGPMP